MTAFLKMHGLGNDFVVFDARNQGLALDSAAARTIADRRLGVGCDQVIVIEPAKNGADAFMRIYNADGGEVESCGNAARCVAQLLMWETGGGAIRLDTAGGPLSCASAGDMVTVDMGAPRFGWRDIPMVRAMDGSPIQLTLHCIGERNNETEVSGFAVSVGNPHFVVPVANAEATPVYELGGAASKNAIFANGTNVEFFSVAGPGRVRMRVFERGVGVTRACGTGACATAVIANLRGMTGRKVEVILDGGSLFIEWRESDDHILMTGPISVSFRGELAL